MKLNSFICIVLTTLISSQIFAGWQFQGQGRVIDEQKTLSAGTIDGGIIDTPLNLNTAKSRSVSASAIALSTSGAVNSTFNVFGQHSIAIRNSTMSPQRYKYYYQLCADKTKCIYYSGNIELNPGSIGQHQAATYVTVQFSTPGMYYSEAKTQIAGEQTAHNVGQGYISIFKP